VLVAMPKMTATQRPDDAELGERMRMWRSTSGLGVVFEPAAFCAETCIGRPQACAAARALVSDPAVKGSFARLVLSMIEDADALDRLWPHLVEAVRARRPVAVDEADLLRSLAGHLPDALASRRGAQAGWTYGQAEAFAARLREVLLEKLEARAAGDARLAFREQARHLLKRSYEPYPRCATVCDQAQPPLCLYRHWLADLVAADDHRERWDAAAREDRGDGGPLARWNAAQDAAFEAIEFPGDDWASPLRQRVAASARRASLCFAQQVVTVQERRLPHTTARTLDRILRQAGVQEQQHE
jgi:hypothetical protein